MVVCRCGCKFENSRWDSHVVCPKCKRVYPNVAPDMVCPKTEEERGWNCVKCGAGNSNSYSGCPRRVCASCGADRPGSPDSWYAI